MYPELVGLLKLGDLEPFTPVKVLDGVLFKP